MPASSQHPILRFETKNGSRTLVLSGRLDAKTVAPIWNEALSIKEKGGGNTVDASAVDFCDGAGLALFCELRRRGIKEISGLKPEIQKLLEPYKEVYLSSKEREKQPKESPIVSLGKIAAIFFNDLREQVNFLGKLAVTLAACVVNPRLVRWTDMWLIVQRSGVNALPIVGLISFLTGLILAFQASVALRQFGVEVFAIDLVALSVLREMGVIMTAVVFSGRSASAFAAEIGTMKVNEELNALETMGLDPMRFLVVPRVLTGFMIVPLLTIYSDLLGVAGGFFVMLCTGFPWPTLWNEVVRAVDLNDIFAGLIKSFVFGFLVAGIGCLRGLQTGNGASAVGISTTRAVVTSIFLVVVVDAVFAFVYNVFNF